MSFKDFLNWAAAPAACQYTVPEIVGVKSLSFKFGRAARIVERVATVPVLALSGAIAVGGGGLGAAGHAPEAAALGLGAAFVVAVVGKAHGLCQGAIVHFVGRGLQKLVNETPKP